MSRNYKYTVLVRFSRNGSNNEIKNTQINYPFSNDSSYKDNLIIKEKSIKLIANRSKKNDLNDIFYNSNLTIVSQLTKAIVYYYCVLGESNPISSIKVTRYHKKDLQKTKLIKKSEISQVIEQKSDLSILTNIKTNELETIFEENEKGHALIFALTHLINSCISTKPFVKFEKSWKSFNSIYKLKGTSHKDSTCLQELREHMVTNIADYPISTFFVSTFSKDMIFNYISWRKMILNDFDTEAKTGYFKGFVERISDIRLIQIINETISIRKDFLSNKGLLIGVMNHISNKLSQNHNVDIDVVAFLCLRYMYYLRNKVMHAERVDPNFHLLKNDSNEEMKVKWCNEVLVRLLIDLININTKF